MSEDQYDDSLLMTSEYLGNIDWDGLEMGGIPAEGQHLAIIRKVQGKMVNFKDYSGPVAKVQLEILEGEDKGKKVFDSINMPTPGEKQGNQNRRILIASRMGLIPQGCKDTVNIEWKLLEGKKALITVVHKKGTGDKADKTYANIDFAGYEAPDTAGKSQGAASHPAQYADI
jgi:hypothetical protein